VSSQKHSSLGSIYQRKSDGKWVASLRVGGGRRITRYAANESQARGVLQTLLREHGAGTLVAPTTTTLAQWVDVWLKLTEANLRPTTLAVYGAALAPVVAHLGPQRLCKLTPLMLAGTFATLQRRGKGRRALQQSYAYLQACLDRAVALGFLGANPLRRVPRPMYSAGERHIWSREQTTRFIAAASAAPHRYAPMLLLLVGSGCRLGEALAVEWGDLDEQAGTVRISKALTVVDGKPIVQQPKTRAGIRTVMLPAFVLAELQRLPRPVAEGPIFRTATGTPPTKRNLLRALRALCVHADVPIVSLHSLRHLNASLALAGGVPLPDVSKHLGHANPGVTSRIYAHALGDGRAVVQAVEAALALPTCGPELAAD
jgi:integrase